MGGRILLSVGIGVIVVVCSTDAKAGLIRLATLHRNTVTIEGAGAVLDRLSPNARLFLDVHEIIINVFVTKRAEVIALETRDSCKNKSM